VTLGQERVDKKTNEITVVPQLLAGRDLTVIKQNQPDLWAVTVLLFQSPPLHPADRPVYTYANKGHGRLERHTLVSSTALNQYLDWPGVQQVLQRTCRRDYNPILWGNIAAALRHYGASVQKALALIGAAAT